MLHTHGFYVNQEQQFSIAGKQNYEEMPDESERLLCGSQEMKYNGSCTQVYFSSVFTTYNYQMP